MSYDPDSWLLFCHQALQEPQPTLSQDAECACAKFIANARSSVS